MQNKILKTIKELALLTIATIIVASSVFFFLIPSSAAVSSVSGLAIILNTFIPLDISIITLIINVSLLIIGYFTIGKEFSYKTVYTSILLPIIIFIYERIFPDFTSLTSSALFDVICYIFFVSVGVSMLFMMNASSGGLDIIAAIMHKYLHIDLGRAMSVSGMIIAASSFFVFTPEVALLSVIGTYFNGIIIDHFIFSRNAKKKVCIISENHLEEIRKFILFDLHSGASIYEVTGAFHLQSRTEIETIVNHSEFQKLMTFLKEVDSDAFVTVYNLYDMHYKIKPYITYNDEEYVSFDQYKKKQKID